MLTTADLVYYTIYLLSLILSFKAGEAVIPGLIFLRLMLLVGLGAEAIVEYLQHLKADDTKPYYAYIPFEYYCLAQFYKKNTNTPLLKRALNISIPVYLIAAAAISIFYHRLSGYPSVLYNVNCFLNTIWIAFLLFNFNQGNGREIWNHPLFIVLSAFLIFFAGVFFFNPAYSYIQNKQPKLAENLRTIVNTGLNYILYILLSYGFICSAKTTK